MSESKIVAVSQPQLHSALLSLWKQYKALGDSVYPLEVVLRPFKRRRSNPQNDRLWLLHTKAAMQINVLKGSRWTREDMHEHFKELYCGNEYIEINGKEIPRTRSSTELSVDEMALAQEKYLAYLVSDLGLEIELED